MAEREGIRMRPRAIMLLLILVAFVSGCQRAHAEHGSHDHPTSEEDGHEGHGHEGHGSKKPKAVAKGEKPGTSEGDDREGKDVHEERTVRLSESGIRRSGIRLSPVATSALNGTVEVPAEVQLNPDRVAHISPLVEGQLLRVHATIGDRIEEKAPLASLRSVALGNARAELSRTNALLSVARKNLERQRNLRAEGISSGKSLLEAKLAFDSATAERAAALSRLSVFGARDGWGPDMTLLSPIAGTILERHATRGENVSPADTLFIVADTSQVWVIGRVYEAQIGQVETGLPATLSLNAFPSRTWSGTVSFVGATIDEETRTLPIRVELDNESGELRPGLFGSLRLASKAATGSVAVVPETAVQTMDNRPVVFVGGHDDGEFEARSVVIGKTSHGKVEVLKGLESGDLVVVDGGFVLKSELMRSELGHGHAH